MKSADTGNNRFYQPAVIRGTAASHVVVAPEPDSCDYRHSCFPRGGGTRTGSLLAVITGTAASHVVVAPEPVLC